MKNYCIVVFLLSSISFCKSQSVDSLKTDLAKTNRYFIYNYENDFFSYTDRYFTQGINPELMAPFMRKSPLSKVLIPLNKNVQNYYGLAFEQDCFTPKSIRLDTLNKLDRPFSAVFFMTHLLISIDSENKRRLTTKFDIGVIGPCARCEEEQKAIHKALVNIQPLGWEGQVRNDLVLNYSASFEQGFFLWKHVEFIALADARLGTLYDDIGGGIYFRLGLMNSYFKNLGVVKNASSNKFQFYFTVRGNGKIVAYNATLQGGPFDRSAYTLDSQNICRTVFSGSGSLVLAYKRVSFEFAKYYLSKEYLTCVNHGWGRCTVMVCF